MGWFFITLVLPIALPVVILALLRCVDLPKPYSERAHPLRVVRDGQLGWIAMSFAASCSYELWAQVSGNRSATHDSAGLVLVVSVVLLVVSGVLSMAGTLFPFDESKVQGVGWKAWLVHYKLFAATAFCTALTTVLYTVVHFYLSVAPGLPVFPA